MPNPNDGTQLGTSEIISDEYIDPNQQVRRDQNLPATAYKAPRSKIAVGPYGQDWGDATHDQPLTTESRAERHVLEILSLRERDQSLSLLQRSIGESFTLADSRGHHMTTRGQR